MLIVKETRKLAVRERKDEVTTRRLVRETAESLGMRTIQITELLTATSELLSNVFKFAGEGEASIDTVEQDGRVGIRLIVEDRGPGIKDLDKAMTDGYSTAKTLGLGLPGTRRLVDEFVIISQEGEGTRATVTKWC